MPVVHDIAGVLISPCNYLSVLVKLSSWSIRIVWFSVQSLMAMVKDIRTIGCGSLLDWKCQCHKNMCQCFCYCDELINEKLRRICGILAGIEEKIRDGSFFPRTRQGGADPVITEARRLFPGRHTNPCICLTAGSVLSGLLTDVQEQYAGMWCRSNFHKKVCELNPKV